MNACIGMSRPDLDVVVGRCTRHLTLLFVCLFVAGVDCLMVWAGFDKRTSVLVCVCVCVFCGADWWWYVCFVVRGDDAADEKRERERGLLCVLVAACTTNNVQGKEKRAQDETR